MGLLNARLSGFPEKFFKINKLKIQSFTAENFTSVESVKPNSEILLSGSLHLENGVCVEAKLDLSLILCQVGT